MLKFLDIVPIEDDDLSKYKLHFAIGPPGSGSDKKEPLYELFKGKFKDWQEIQTKPNFNRDYILSLIYFDKDEWLFGGIYKSGEYKKKGDRLIYSTKLTDIKKDLIGRLIIRYDKPRISGRASYLLMERWVDQLEVSQILKKPYSVEPFPGYENVMVNYSLLKTIIQENEESWFTALSNMKGVYLIVDKKSGKQYVGSAYGEEAFWTRWTQYVKNGHGGNKLLRKLMKEKGLEYSHNYQFSILEIRSMKTEDKEIIDRESYWKNALLSREFGYNEN